MLRVQNLTKRFGHVTAISNVSANIRKGRVTALLGDNGAGKSTLVKMICGTYKPTQGSVWVNGKQVHMDSARDALALGITAVYQDLALVDQRNVIHNISLGNIPTKWGGLVVDRKKMRETAENALSYMKAKLPSLDIPVSSMSGGQRQAVAIASLCLRRATRHHGRTDGGARDLRAAHGARCRPRPAGAWHVRSDHQS